MTYRIKREKLKKIGIREYHEENLTKSELGKILYKKLLKINNVKMWALGIMEELYNDDAKIQKIMDIVDNGADVTTISIEAMKLNKGTISMPSEKLAGFSVRRIYYYEDRAYYYYYVTDKLKDGVFVKYRRYKSVNGEELTKREELKTDLDKKLYDELKPLSPHPDWFELMLMLSSGDDKRQELLKYIQTEKAWSKIDSFVTKKWGDEGERIL